MTITSRPFNKQGRDNWDRIFRKKSRIHPLTVDDSQVIPMTIDDICVIPMTVDDIHQEIDDTFKEINEKWQNKRTR